MIVGLIDVDGHNFPNLALMRISAYHKGKGDDVEWWQGDLFHYDVVYMSKIFSNDYSPDVPEPINADRVIKGGTGYCISNINGREVFDESKNWKLPEDVEHMFPDYSIYPQFDFAVSMTSRGCPRGCAFCHVAKKEGRCAVKVADVKDFWNGQKLIEVLDSNILACKEKRDLLRQYRETNVTINFNGGLDIRFLNDEDIDDINHIKIKRLHFAWDNPKDDLVEKFRRAGEKLKKDQRHKVVYVLTNYASTHEEDRYRVETLKAIGFDPYVMVYDKNRASKITRDFQRFVNAKQIFWTTKNFDEYERITPEKDDRQIEMTF